MQIQFRCQKLYVYVCVYIYTYGMISFLIKPFHDLRDGKFCKADYSPVKNSLPVIWLQHNSVWSNLEKEKKTYIFF